MGASVKTLSRLATLSDQGYLKPGAAIIELGTQEVYCAGQESHVAELIDHFKKKNPSVRGSSQYSPLEISRMANKGLMGELMTACGFTYCALDIFQADRTIVFDLNLHEPGDLANRFDLVTNLGTTEHVINQYQSMKTMHDLTRPGGIIYHDLPLAGYHEHGYFSYNPLLFQQLATANAYQILLQGYSKGGVPHPAPSFMTANGYPDVPYYDYGMEFIFQKVTDAPFRMPLDVSTSLGPGRVTRPYGSAPAGTDAHAVPSLSRVSGWDLQRELLRRYGRRLSKLLGLARLGQ
jgi:hypothetical protein